MVLCSKHIHMVSFHTLSPRNIHCDNRLSPNIHLNISKLHKYHMSSADMPGQYRKSRTRLKHALMPYRYWDHNVFSVRFCSSSMADFPLPCRLCGLAILSGLYCGLCMMFSRLFALSLFLSLSPVIRLPVTMVSFHTLSPVPLDGCGLCRLHPTSSGL